MILSKNSKIIGIAQEDIKEGELLKLIIINGKIVFLEKVNLIDDFDIKSISTKAIKRVCNN